MAPPFRCALRGHPGRRLVEPVASGDELPLHGDKGVHDLRVEMLAALLEATDDALKLPEELTVGHLTDLLLLYLKPGSLDMEKLYSCLEVSDRARSALELADSTHPGS